MNEIEDLIDIAEEALRVAEKVTNGANVHEMNNCIHVVNYWIFNLKNNIMELKIEDKTINSKDELLKALKKLREIVLKSVF